MRKKTFDFYLMWWYIVMFPKQFDLIKFLEYFHLIKVYVFIGYSSMNDYLKLEIYNYSIEGNWKSMYIFINYYRVVRPHE